MPAVPIIRSSAAALRQGRCRRISQFDKALARRRAMKRKAATPALWGRSWFGGDPERDPFAHMHREIDRLFHNVVGEGRGDSEGGAMMMVPDIDVSETDGELEITAELPGIDEKDVDVSLDNGRLTIKGEKKAEKEEKQKDYHLMERSYGAFSRSIVLPFEVDADKVTADFSKGVLKITLPKPAEVKDKTRKIAIKSG
jgi:HSP20 family protein